MHVLRDNGRSKGLFANNKCASTYTFLSRNAGKQNTLPSNSQKRSQKPRVVFGSVWQLHSHYDVNITELRHMWKWRLPVHYLECWSRRSCMAWHFALARPHINVYSARKLGIAKIECFWSVQYVLSPYTRTTPKSTVILHCESLSCAFVSLVY